MAPTPSEIARAYHATTKHHPQRYARALGYMDWDTQPDPFRRFAGAAEVALPFSDEACTLTHAAASRGELEAGPVADLAPPARLGRMLELCLGLTAWKQFEANRWALRANPSSGNLHPTEGYVVLPAGHAGLPAGVLHYAPREHALELRCSLPAAAATALAELLPPGGFLVGLTSILWREAWKYGERALRYCCLDTGHALAAIDQAAACVGWQATPLPGWTDADLGALFGTDRAEDFAEVDAWEREHPDLLLCVWPGGAPAGDAQPGAGSTKEPSCASAVPGAEPRVDRQVSGSNPAGPGSARLAGLAPDAVLATLASGTWHGHANSLSSEHHEWDVIHATAASTKRVARAEAARPARAPAALPVRDPSPLRCTDQPLDQLLRQRRSAQSMRTTEALSLPAFLATLDATLPRPDVAPWRAQSEGPDVDLLLFVHQVEGLERGLYLLERGDVGTPGLRAALGPSLGWERPAALDPGAGEGQAGGSVDPSAPTCGGTGTDGSPEGTAKLDPSKSYAHLCLHRLRSGHAESLARATSCNQDIAADGNFAVAMIARFAANVDQDPSRYRRLFWECGVIGQVLYIEAEAAGLRGTGIGCYFDDAVHQVLGLRGEEFQVLYHFTTGQPVEDERLQTHPPYAHLER
ncbi:MAG: SagB/ThcOx family dehydrogenase [Planctomycetota bacterium]|nr:SagB/ThcOx family dehydrogenase [Planctomycetota bacterium]